MRVLIKFFKFLALFIHGLLIVYFVFPFKTRRFQRNFYTRQFANRALNILNIQLEMSPESKRNLKKVNPERLMVVANHVSFLDIFILQSLVPVKFIAKSEIKDWFMIGKLVAGGGTLFINREQAKDMIRISELMQNALNDYQCVGFFPEGTTSNGLELKPFKSSLLQPAVACDASVLPITLRYLNAKTKELDSSVAYTTHFMSCLKNVLYSDKILVEVVIPDHVLKHKNRRILTKQAEEIISQNFYKNNEDKDGSTRI